MITSLTMTQSILFVEDSSSNAKIVEVLFRDSDCNVVFAEDGETALELVREYLFDLIILDVHLTGMNGYELCQVIKKMPDRKDIPVIFLSSYCEPEDIIRGYDVGGFDYITKPFNGSEFLARVRAHLNYRSNNLDLINSNQILMQNKRELTEVLNHVGSGIIICSRESSLIAYANKTASEILEESYEAIIGNSLHKFLGCSTGEDIAFIVDESVYTTRMGVKKDLICNISNVVYDELSCVLINFVDISNRKRIEVLREDIDRIVQHDLKSPLNAIMTLPDILRELVDIGEYESDILNLITDAGVQMLDMINLSVDLYKMEHGVYVTSCIPVGVFDVLNKILRDQVRELPNVGRDVTVLHDGVSGGDVEIYMAIEQLACYSMLLNLLKNVLRVSVGEVIVDVANDDEHVFVTISANAVSDEITASFFDKHLLSGKEKGNGLEAYSARLIAETFGGDVILSTEKDTGMQLVACIPIYQIN